MIENIITTHDELFKAMSQENYYNPAAKEVVNYRTALWHGYELVKDKQILTINIIVEIQQLIEKNRDGIRKLPGTVPKNEATGEAVYTPPSGEKGIIALMGNVVGLGNGYRVYYVKRIKKLVDLSAHLNIMVLFLMQA